MENLVDKYRKICCLSIQELLKLHKMYCITLHPLWGQVVNRYWKVLDKYWTPICQVTSKKNFETLSNNISTLLDLSHTSFVPFDNTLLIELLEYYNIEFFQDDKCIDKTIFSALLVFIFSQYTNIINIYPLLFLAFSVFFALLQDTPQYPHSPQDYKKHLPVVKVIHNKDYSDFLLWLYNNFTNTGEIQENLSSLIHNFINNTSVQIWTSEKYSENKKLLMTCRESFFKLLKLKNSEFKTKKILPIMKSQNKGTFKDMFEKCRLPVEGRSIKLSSPQSLNKIKVMIEINQENQPQPEVKNREYHPELYDTLVQQYKLSSKQSHSGAMTPETLSPRIFKQTRGNTKCVTPNRYYTNEIKFRSSRLEKSFNSKPEYIIRSEKRTYSTKPTKRIKRAR
ncbi:hypothetical protein SteCoe_26374 [Stentor coeruleus]|uniref:Uncharacterized protein n=1 Tax=Stentor coeruleus TaxID=5963 RepID=A0A1R2BD04_9CILI|nr:hypothetical protein SteCoe_26374 [Stentor coeruleus]